MLVYIRVLNYNPENMGTLCYTGCIRKKESFRNQAYCLNLNAFAIAHMLNHGA